MQLQHSKGWKLFAISPSMTIMNYWILGYFANSCGVIGCFKIYISKAMYEILCEILQFLIGQKQILNH